MTIEVSQASFQRKRTKKIIMSGLCALTAISLAACGSGDKKLKTTPTVGVRVPVLSKIEAGAVVDPSLAQVSVIVPPAEFNESWPQAGGNAAKSAGNYMLSDKPLPVWHAKIAGANTRRRLAAAPVIGDGLLFAVGTDGVVSAFDAASGARRWTHAMKVKGNLAAAAFGGGVSFDDGRVYAASGTGEVVALNAASGEVIWSVQPAGPLRGSPTVAFGSVFVVTQDNQLHALNSVDGTAQWQESGSSAQTGVFGVASPAAGLGTIVAGYSSGELAAYRYENGRTLWSDALALTSISTKVGSLYDIDADPIIDRGRVYALGQGGRMAAYELNTGQRVWELSVAGISTPTIAGEWIFALTDQAQLLAIARSSGKVRWISQLQRYKKEKKRDGAIFWTGPVLAGGSLWVASTEGEVFKVNISDGAATLYKELGAGVSLPPVVANGVLYILDDGGTIHALK